MTECQAVLRVQRFLLDVRATVEAERLSTTREIKGQQPWQKVGTGRIVEVRIGNGKLKPFVQERVRELKAKLRIVLSFNVRQIRLDADVVQSPRLAEADCLIRKRIRAGEVLDVVEPVVRID